MAWKIFVACAEALRLEFHGGHNAEAGGESGEKGGAGGRGEFGLWTGAIDRAPFEEKGSGGCGDGECAVFSFDGSAAYVDARTVDFGNTERVKSDARADDVADGIDGAHFVEVDFLNGDVMRFGLGFG